MPAVRRMAAAAALLLAAVVGTAAPASAHAVLLRTDPSPQTTVARPPSAIRLMFSEPVETPFGAIRVYDVDGHRVNAGSIKLADGGRTVVLPVSGLKDGTYTVTWKAVSADGHLVSGGFSFYVGAPSTISAVAVAKDQGPGEYVSVGFGVVRFLWFAALMALVGLVALRRWIWTPSVRTAGLADSPAAASFRRSFGRALPAAWAVLATVGVLSIVFQASTVSGLSLISAARPSVLRDVLRTTFGHVWIAQMALTAAALLPVLALSRGRPRLGLRPSGWITVVAVLAAGLCLCAALNGHARTDARPVLDEASIAVHLLAAGVWVGGLAGLVALGAIAWRRVEGNERRRLLRQLVPRFSRLALVAVAMIVVTGVVNSFANLAHPSDLWTYAYGRVLLAKIAVLVLALVLAARHRWVIPRRLERSESGDAPVRSFERTAAFESLFVLGAVGLAAALVALVPGRSIALAANGPVNREQKVGAYTAQLFIDPTQVGANQVHVTFVNAQGLGAAEVTNTTVEIAAPATPPAQVSMRLISPGHFVGDMTLPVAGSYRLTVSLGPDSTSFDFRLRPGSGKA
jgi:copper transport protein